MRIAVALALALLAIPAHAASPKVEAAIKTIRAVAADPNLQRTFCALLEMKEKLDDKKDDPKIEAAMDEYVKRLGPNFQSAWRLGETRRTRIDKQGEHRSYLCFDQRLANALA